MSKRFLNVMLRGSQRPHASRSPRTAAYAAVHLLAAFAVLAVAAFAPAALAQAPAAGIDYVVLNEKQPTETPDKVEVLEFFWYGCPHCYTLEPALDEWARRQPKDVAFKRVPAPFNKQWEIGARVFYALEAIGEADRLTPIVFNAIHREGVRANDEKAISAVLAKNKVDMAKYDAAYKSFGVDAKIRRAEQLLKAYRLDAVPAVAVNGKYLVSASLAGGHKRMIDIIDMLVAQSRKEIAAGK
jgi:thiol:disulfide interchange protein DsbA